ncbi:MAG: site-specific integrase [Paludibacteraceae bacterium]|nr:site-specific integrase [Paludibacteraceae bacterium]
MPINEKPQNADSLNYNYLPAVLKEYPSGWMIEYYVESPKDHQLKRIRIRVDKIRKRYKLKMDARKHVMGMVLAINNKLMTGWNPFFHGEDSRLYVSMKDVSELFINEKKKEMRPDTMRSYSSFINIFLGWLNRYDPKMFASMFTRVWAVKFMDYAYNERNVSARTYNNYLKISKVMFNWSLEKCYVKENPFNSIKSKRKEPKTRTIIPKQYRDMITKHLEGDNFLIVCNLVYTSLIRPKEIRNLRVGDVDLEGRFIRVPGEVAKNHHSRYSAINKKTIDLLKGINLERYKKTDFLFSDIDTLYPGSVQLYSSKFTKLWDSVRKELKLPKEMQLYSLRDTGISEMIKAGIDDLSIMQHADHSSLDITSIYAKHEDPNLVKLIYEKAPEF